MEFLSSSLAGVVGLGAMALGVAMLLAGVLLLGARRRRTPGDGRAEALGRLGYSPDGPKRWSQPINRTRVVFQELPAGGYQWTVQLTRYNTLTMQVEERDHPAHPSAGQIFATQHPAMDARFVVSSELPAQAVALATNTKVIRFMLATPFLSLHLRGDELVFEDPELRGLKKLLGGSTNGTAAKKRAAEKEVHEATIALATVILDALYTKTSGTLFAEHR